MIKVNRANEADTQRSTVKAGRLWQVPAIRGHESLPGGLLEMEVPRGPDSAKPF